MLGNQEGKDQPTGVARKTYLRSVSWSGGRSPSNPNAGPQQNSKGRPCLPPLQPLSISRRKVEEWPGASSDDLGVWPNPPTPGARPGMPKPLKVSEPEQPLREFQFKREKLAFFDKECSRIADHIYLGSDAVAKNREILRQNRITHVLNCVGFVSPEYFKSDLVYKTLWLQDSPSEDITSILYDVFDYFEDVREQSGRVLVHCCQGVSRSTSLVIAYLMWREGQSFDDAFQFVKAARGVTNPNMGFACQLLQCQNRVLAVPASPNSMLRMYRMAPHSPYDPLHLVPKLLNHPGVGGLDSRGAFIVHASSALYVWIGRRCTPVMSSHATAAASQVSRYERVGGPILTFKEGEEPSKFWDAFASGQSLSDGSIPPRVGNRKVDEYDFDFELYIKAFGGGVVPPVSLSGTGFETRLPARENGWDRLRRRLANGSMKDLVLSAKQNLEISQSNHESDMMMDDADKVKSDARPADHFLTSTVSTSLPDSESGLLNRLWNAPNEVEHSTPLADPSLLPQLPSGTSDTVSCSSGSSAKFSSKSPTQSPSTSDCSILFTCSPSSSNWSDQSIPSSQSSPSSLESEH